MAIFKVPKINTENRASIVLDVSELVYDTDDTFFYGGDGETLGGRKVGSDLVEQKREVIIIDQMIVQENRIMLQSQPLENFPILFFPEGGPQQVEEIDYTRISGGVSFVGLGLENFLEVGERVEIVYTTETN